jgi:peptidoglycan-N-acetylglucosamine deacetylase
MLRFRITVVTFLVLILTILMLNHFYALSLSYLIIPFLFIITSLTLAAFLVNSQFYVRTICKVPNDKNEIAITFDDGPDKVITPQILNILEKYNVPSMFFCIGEKAKENKELLLQIHQAGHLVGNHSFSHAKRFDLYTRKKMIEEFNKTNNNIFRIIGEKPVYFRPPYGVTNPTMRQALKKFDLITIGWSLRSFDTIKSKEKALKRVLKKIKSGDIVVFHDNVPITPQVIEAFIPVIINKGFKIVRLDHLINQKSI